MQDLLSSKKIAWIIFFVFVGAGIVLRFYHIKDNDFLFYDEGMWLGYHRDFVQLVSQNPPHNLQDFQKIVFLMVGFSLAAAKSLWAFLSMLRGLLINEQALYFTRLISAICGTLTLVMTYCLGKEIYKDRLIGFCSVIVLAFLPSHVFYSRLGLQEAFSAFFFTAGLYLYVCSPKFNWKTAVSSFCFVFLFLSNYRMIIVPVFLAVFELLYSFSQKQKFNFRKYVWHVVLFFSLVFLIGNLHHGQNTEITFAWMFYQAHLASGGMKLYNFLSFPYYLFRLESWLFGLCFFAQVYFIWKKDWLRCFLFLFILFEMFMFSLSEEKGVRYLASSLPLLTVSVSAAIVYFYQKCSSEKIKWGIVVALGLMSLVHFQKSLTLVTHLTDYRVCAKVFSRLQPPIKILSTQSQVQQLYFPSNQDVLEPPLKLSQLLAAYTNGYRYLVVDPQAFISFTQDGHRFSFPLRGYLGFIVEHVKPIKNYPHMSKVIFERFVLEHNVDLKQSLNFLSQNSDGHLSTLYIYDLTDALKAIHEQYDTSRGM